MPTYRLDPFEPADSAWQKSIMDPETCWVAADSEDEARAIITGYAFGHRTPEGADPLQEMLPWTALASCSLDETVAVAPRIILTARGQKISTS